MPTPRSAIIRLDGLLIMFVGMLGAAIATAPPSALACVVGAGTTVSCTEVALNACLPGGGSFDGTVTFNCGGAATITVTSTKTISADTTIDGGSVITISGGMTVGVFSVNSGVTFRVQNLTIADGAIVGSGGAIHNNGGTLTVTNCIFSGNSATPPGGGLGQGGAIFFADGTLSVTGSTFSGNSAPDRGSAIGTQISNFADTMTVTNCTFTGNGANGGAGGGAIYLDAGTLTVTDSTFSDNSNGAISSGGSLIVTGSTFSGNTVYNTYDRTGGAINSGGPLTVSNSTFSSNFAAAGAAGGAIFCADALIVTNSTFSGNGALDGGAIASDDVLTVTNCTFDGNSASGPCVTDNGSGGTGGAIVQGALGTLTVTNSTFSGNSASGCGGTIFTFGGATTLINSILANNSGGNCGSANVTITDGGHNIDDGTTCSFTGTGCTNTTGTSFCNTNPLLDPAGLASNGGPTQNIALESGSPAINAGDETVCMAPPVNNLDQRGFVRPGMGATNCSIGAFESNAAPPPCTTPPANLVGWWPGDGGANDISGNGNNGTLQNGATFAAGLVGQAFSFDGVDDQVLVPHNADQNTGSQITVDAWVYPTALSHGRTIIQKRSASNIGGFTFEQLGQPFAPDGSLQWVIMISGVYHSATATSVLTLNTWQHVAATYDGSLMEVYVNGVQQGSVAQSGPIDAVTDPIVIGRNVVVPSDAWQGLIDEVELFSRALSQSEIQSIVEAGSAGKCKPCVPPPAELVSWWPGEGTAADLTGGNSGTLQGNVVFVPGEVGQAFGFDGTDGEGVGVGNPANLQLQDFTIDAWLKRSRLDIAGDGPSHEGAIVAYGHDGYAFGLLADGELFLTQVDESFIPSGTGLEVTDTNFHHVAVTKAGTSVVFYLDGTPGAAVSYGPTFSFTKDLSLGARLDVSAPSSTALTATFAGVLDEIEIFSRALTADEINAIFSAGSAGKCKVPPTTTTTTSSTSTTTSTTTSSTTSTTRLTTTTTSTTHATTTTTSTTTSTTTTTRPTTTTTSSTTSTTHAPTITTSTTATTTTVPPTTTTLPAAQCPLSMGFWKTHPAQWPVASLTLGSQTYTQAELLPLLTTPVRGDASLILADQLIAAKLNIANGADPTLVSTIADADNLLSGFAGKLPYKVNPNSAVRQQMIHDATVLAQYNDGALTPRCSVVPADDAPDAKTHTIAAQLQALEAACAGAPMKLLKGLQQADRLLLGASERTGGKRAAALNHLASEFHQTVQGAKRLAAKGKLPNECSAALP